MLRRLLNFFVRPIADPAIVSLYRSCVMQARQPAFYADLHVPDTVDGRFDLLLLHVLLVILRLHGQEKETQQLFDVLFADMDTNLREMGVSDISIAKKMKPMLAAFYGRAKIYEQALGTDDATLAEALQRNVYGQTPVEPQDLQRLTAYVRRAYKAIETQDQSVLHSGTIRFPWVEQND